MNIWCCRFAEWLADHQPKQVIHCLCSDCIWEDWVDGTHWEVCSRPAD